MGKLFSLDAATKATIRDALDDLVAEFGKDCLLSYPPKWSACANCVPDGIGKKSSGRWRHGGPLQFQAGTICPLCEGRGGFAAEERTETIRLKVEWEPAKFWLPVPNNAIRVPHSVCQTKGFVWDIPKLVQAEFLVIQLPIAPFTRARFKLSGTPISPGNIVQDRYAVATWESFG